MRKKKLIPFHGEIFPDASDLLFFRRFFVVIIIFMIWQVMALEIILAAWDSVAFLFEELKGKDLLGMLSTHDHVCQVASN